MNGAEATARWEERKAALMTELTARSTEEKRALIKAASQYRSGTDSCNSVYMGGMAHAMLRRALGGGGYDGLDELLAAANAAQLNAGLDVCSSYIETMRRHPTKKCPCCGQIVSVKEGES